jgi:Cache 3/Cache 2 fusion domain
MKRIIRSLIAALATGIFAASTLWPSMGSAQDARDVKAMEALKAETGKQGVPKVEGGDLYFGKTKVDNSAVDDVVKTHGGAATIFVKNGDQYQRVATTVKKEDGTSAVGIALDANSPAVANLNNGKAYAGDATVFGKPYLALYEPIMDSSGAVIGAYFIGYAK